MARRPKVQRCAANRKGADLDLQMVEQTTALNMLERHGTIRGQTAAITGVTLPVARDDRS